MSRGPRLTLLLLAAAGLAGCVTLRPPAQRPKPPAAALAQPAPTAVAPQTRIVRVPVKCVPDSLGPAPAYPDSDKALRDAGGAADRYQLMAAGRILREQRLQKLEDVVKRCRNAAR
jgi:hypothetical protein